MSPGSVQALVGLIVQVQRNSDVHAVCERARADEVQSSETWSEIEIRQGERTEGDEKLIGSPDPSEGVDHALLLPDVPDKLGVTDPRRAVESSFVVVRQVLELPSRRVVAVVADVEVLEPVVSPSDVAGGLVLGENVRHDDDTCTTEIIGGQLLLAMGEGGRLAFLEEHRSPVVEGLPDGRGEGGRWDEGSSFDPAGWESRGSRQNADRHVDGRRGEEKKEKPMVDDG